MRDSKGSFYNYFKSKEELLVSIFKFYYEALTDSLLDLELDASLSSKDKFMRQITVHIGAYDGKYQLDSNDDAGTNGSYQQGTRWIFTLYP